MPRTIVGACALLHPENEEGWECAFPSSSNTQHTMKTPEKKVKDAAVEILKQYRAYYFFPVMGGYGRSGIPDIIACLDGQFIGIECKAGFNKPTLLQERELAEITKAGGRTIVVREDTLDLLNQLLKEIKYGT